MYGRKFVVSVLAAVFVFAFAVAGAFANDRCRAEGEAMGCPGACKGKGRDGGRGYHRGFSEAIAKLDLSDEQKKALYSIKLEYKKETIMKEADIKIAGVELKGLLSDDEVDLDAVKAKLDEKALLKSELKFYRLKMREEVKKLLTSKQRRKFKEFMPYFGGYGKHWKGKGKHGRECNGRDG